MIFTYNQAIAMLRGWQEQLATKPDNNLKAVIAAVEEEVATYRLSSDQYHEQYKKAFEALVSAQKNS